MKKSHKQFFFSRFRVALSELNSGQQFFLVVIVFGILLFALWTKLASYFPSSEPLESTASYEGLDPASLGYWRERAERDIESAKNIAGKSHSSHLEILLRRNLSATIQTASQIKDPVEKTTALAAIVNAQVSQNIGTNINEALKAIDRSQECQQIKMSLYAPLAFFYIQSNNPVEAKSAINEYFQFLRENPVDPDNVEQRELLNRITDACVILDMEAELSAFLQDLMLSTNALRSDLRKDKYLSLIAEQQIRLQKYSDAIATLETIKTPELLAQGFQKLIENRVRLSTPNYEKMLGTHSISQQRHRIRYPEMIAQLLERIYIIIGRIKSTETQSRVFERLFESEIMLYPELRDLIRGVLLESRSIEPSVKAKALAVLDNPQSKILREAMGMTSLEPESDSSSATEANRRSQTGLVDKNQYAFAAQSISQDRIYVEEIRIDINTAIEFLKWNNRKDAIPLLNRAVEKSKGLVLDKKQGVSRTIIATLLLGAGEIESAQSVLVDAFALLNYLKKTKQIDAEFVQIAEVQIRGRLLDDALLTIREILPGEEKNSLVQLLVDEWIRIGRWREAFRCTNEMPASLVKTRQQDFIRKTRERFEKKKNENLYENPALNEILRSETPEKSELLFHLLQSQIQKGLLFDAHETAKSIIDSKLRNRALKRIVQESILSARPYFTQLPFHYQVRQEFYTLGMQVAKEIDVPEERLSEMLNVYAQSGWNLPNTSTEDDVKEMLKLWETLSGAQMTFLKVNFANRLVQVWMRCDATSSVSWISGPRYFFDAESANVESRRQKNRELLLKAAQLAQTLVAAEERTECFQELSSLFYLNGDSDNGKIYHEHTLSQIGQLRDQKRKSEIYLSLAQTQHLADNSEESQKMFLDAITAADAILSKNPDAKRIDRILEKRTRERMITDICRGKAEIGLLHDAIKTSDLIGEPFLVDRLCQTIGYIQLNGGSYKDAEVTFKKIGDSRIRNSCLNDVTFQRNLQNFSESSL